MTHEEIIAMAREAGFRTGHIDLTIGDPVPFIAPASGTSCIVEVQRFAALVAEKAATKEREACAQYMESCGRYGHAAAIRAREQKDGCRATLSASSSS